MDRGDPGPGSAQLVQLIEDGHGAALRYDLQRLGLDLADVWRGSLAPRRVLDLVEHLPDDSALAARLRGGSEHRPWDLKTYLLAALVDAEHHTAWVVAQSNSKKKIPRPRSLPRPQAAGAERPRLDLSRHPLARPLPAKYLNAIEASKGG